MSTAAITVDPSQVQSISVDPSEVQAVTSEPPRTWKDSVGDFGAELWKQVNPISGIKGMAQMVNHPIDTFKSDADARQQVYSEAEKSFKSGDYTGGAAHLLYSVLPLIGPQLDAAGNNFAQGNYAKGSGASVGMGLAMAAPEAMKGINLKAPVGDVPESLYQSALKPSTRLPGSKVASMVQTGLDKEIPVSAAGAEKISGLLDDLNQKVTDTIAADPNRPINKFAVASRLEKTADQFATQVNPAADLKAVGEAGNEFLGSQPGEIPASQAQALKTGTYQQLSGKAYGELQSAAIESQKALARGLKEELNSAFPELSGLNAQESKLYDLQPVIEQAIKRQGNHQILGIGTPIAAGGVKAVTGSTPIAASAGILKAIIDNPAVKSRLAIALERASKGSLTPSAITTRLAGYSNALGNAASQNPDDQGAPSTN